jgi:hypothetical protein
MGVREGGLFRIDMPRLSQYFTRAAMFNLLLGFTFGALMLSNKGIPIHPSLWRLLPAHIEILLLGWTLQLAFGVAFWIAPRFLERTRQVNKPPRGNETGAWIALALLNAGVWLVALGAYISGHESFRNYIRVRGLLPIPGRPGLSAQSYSAATSALS